MFHLECQHLFIHLFRFFFFFLNGHHSVFTAPFLWLWEWNGSFFAAWHLQYDFLLGVTVPFFYYQVAGLLSSPIYFLTALSFKNNLLWKSLFKSNFDIKQVLQMAVV